MNIEETAKYALSEALLFEIETLEAYTSENLIEAARDGYSPELIYNHDAVDIINEYESEYGSEAEDLCHGEFKAEDWQEAQFEYASAILAVAFDDELTKALPDVDENIQQFVAEVELLGGDPAKACFSTDCAYGWEAHNYETYEGVMVWGARNPHGHSNCNPTLLEGELYAVSFRVTTWCWLNLAWTPDSNGQCHADLIKEWADGVDIQGFNKITGEWVDEPDPRWLNDREYRIKPEPQKLQRIDWLKMPKDTLCLCDGTPLYFSGRVYGNESKPLFIIMGKTTKSACGLYLQGDLITPNEIILLEQEIILCLDDGITSHWGNESIRKKLNLPDGIKFVVHCIGEAVVGYQIMPELESGWML